MLKMDDNNVDLEKERIKALEFIPEEAKQFIKENSFSTLNIKYPVTRYPVKPKSLNIVVLDIFLIILYRRMDIIIQPQHFLQKIIPPKQYEITSFQYLPSM